MKINRIKIINLTQLLFLIFCCNTALLADGLGPLPISLKDAPVPEVPGLFDGSDPIIVNKEKAIILGKALFWDMNVGSDGTACATCHFHAGADRRTKNQLAPIGSNSELLPDFSFGMDGSLRGSNATLTKNDFPFFDRANAADPSSDITYNSDDVVGSAGSFGGIYRKSNMFFSASDDCDRSVDPVFHVGPKGTRKVTSRNTPTVINAVFNFRNFWDGRANNIFNGSNPWGDRDPDAGVWMKGSDGSIAKKRLRLINSSLASQAVGPPMDDIEMSCKKRTFPELGRKLLYRQPLEHQKVHWNDSVLGDLAFSVEGELMSGLNTRYYRLVMEAFNSKYWSHIRRGQFGSPPSSAEAPLWPYSQMEANFSMFFGLSLQVYMSTLISDDSPFDRTHFDEHEEHDNDSGLDNDHFQARQNEDEDDHDNLITMSESAKRGRDIFIDAHCAMCHFGPNLTSSAVVTNGILQQIEPSDFGQEIPRANVTDVVTVISATGGGMFEDVGFAGTGVTPKDNDPGLGGFDPFGNPLSFADQYMQLLAGNETGVVDPYVADVRPCDMDFSIASADLDQPHPFFFTLADGIQPQTQNTVDCINPLATYIPTVETARAELKNPDRRRFLSAASGSFKVPTLRNIELTGPYMHNGGMATLEQVIEFYARGGNFEVDTRELIKVFNQPSLLDPQQLEDLLNFLKSLTDERVRYQKAPFDHPELFISNGHVGDNALITIPNTFNPILAADEILVIPAVGAKGSNKPLQPFEFYLEE